MATDHNIPALNGLEPLPFHWGHRYFDYLPTSFDDSLSWSEQIAQFVEYLNQMHRLSDEMVAQWEEIKAWIMNDGVSNAVEKVMQQWIDDGTIAKLISNNVLSDMWGAIKALASGSPKGTFANYNALVAAYPNGDNGVYITTDTGHWWYWSDTAWHDGGQYQSTGIADGSIVNAMLKNHTITDSKVNDVNTNKIADSYSENGDVTVWNGIGSVSIDGQTAVYTKPTAGDGGLTYPVVMPRDLSLNEPVYLNFDYRTTGTDIGDTLTVYIINNNKLITPALLSLTKSDTQVHARATLNYAFWSLHNMSKSFRLLISAHGGSGTLTISDLNVSFNDNRRSFTNNVKHVIKAIDATNDGYGVTPYNINDNLVNEKEYGMWNASVAERIDYDPANGNIIFNKNTTGDCGIIFHGNIPVSLEPIDYLTVNVDYATRDDTALTDEVGLYLGDANGAIVGSALKKGVKTSKYVRLSATINAKTLSSLVSTSNFSIIVAIHGGTGKLRVRKPTVNLSGNVLRTKEKAIREAGIVRDTGNYNSISYASIRNNFANTKLAHLWGTTSADNLYLDNMSGNVIIEKNGGAETIGLLIPVDLPPQLDVEQNLIIETGCNVINAGSLATHFSCYIANDYGETFKNLYTVGFDNKSGGIGIKISDLLNLTNNRHFCLMLTIGGPDSSGSVGFNHVIVNIDRGERTLVEEMKDWHALNNASFNLQDMIYNGQITEWNGHNQVYFHTIGKVRLDYTQTKADKTNDHGIKFLLNRTAFKPNTPIFINFSSITRNGSVDMGLFDSKVAYKKHLYDLSASKGFVSNQVIIQPSELDAYGITDTFYVSINTHAIGTAFKIKDFSASNVKMNDDLITYLNDTETSNGMTQSELLGQNDDFSIDTDWTKTRTPNLKMVTPNGAASYDSILKNIYAYVTTAGNYKFTVGTLDQHELLVNGRDFTLALTAGMNVLDVADQNINVYHGEQVFLDRTADNYLFKGINSNQYYDCLIQDDAQLNDPNYSGYYFHAPSDSSINCGFGYRLISAGIKQLVDTNTKDIAEINGTISTLATNIIADSNGKKYKIVVDENGQLSTLALGNKSVTILGNSLTKTRGDIGMCASDQNHDYYHYVTQHVLEANPSAHIAERQNIANFEQLTTTAERSAYVDATVLPMISSDDDLIVIQLIDNVNTDERLATFESDSVEMVKKIKAKAPKATIIWVAGWFASDEKIAMLQKMCSSVGIEFVNIIDLARDSNNKGYIGMQRTGIDGSKWTVTAPGEAAHPGDTGMKLIANRIIAKMGY